jgi:hypothetical protein
MRHALLSWNRLQQVVLTLVLLLVMYTLSIGPYAWLAMRGYVPEASGAGFYAPITRLVQSSDLMRSMFTAYVRLWTP